MIPFVQNDRDLWLCWTHRKSQKYVHYYAAWLLDAKPAIFLRMYGSIANRITRMMCIKLDDVLWQHLLGLLETISYLRVLRHTLERVWSLSRDQEDPIYALVPWKNADLGSNGVWAITFNDKLSNH